MANELSEKHVLKKSGIKICKYGFGAWGIGGIHYGEVAGEEAKRVISRYIEAGGNYIDTARAYGASEELLGETLDELGVLDDVVLSTKTKAGEFADTIDQIRPELERSLRALRRDYIDIFFLHWPPEDPKTIDAALRECLRLREEGLIRAVGISLKGPDVFQSTSDTARIYIKDGRIDVIMMVYSILRQLNRQVFVEAEKAGIGIIARTCLESGFLTGAMKRGLRFPETDHRCRWNDRIDSIVQTVDDLKRKVVKPPYQGLNEVAIRFTADEPGVTSVIVGALEVAHMEANLRAAGLSPLDPEIIAYIKDEFGDCTEQYNSGTGTEPFHRPDDHR